jgi:protocatechuate 3,4-dioxygenase beta subunit
MKPASSAVILILSVCALVFSVAAQNSSAPRAAIEGIVTKDPGGEPVKKAIIELIGENQAENGDYTAVSGTDGRFRIEGIVPGRYHLFAERTGYLELEKHRARSEGRILALTAGQELKDIQIRLQAAAVLRGRVSDEDGDPLANAQVAVLRQTYASGRSRWEQAGSERTNDLGEYRIAGLSPGNYFVSVNPPPDFKSLIEASGSDNRRAVDKPEMSYQTTYYPGTTDRGQAAAIQLHAGDEFPVNFSLTQSPTLSIRGSVVNLPPQSSAVIMLKSRDFNLVLNGAEMHKDGSFVIRDVAPGAYTIFASVENAAVPMMARQALQVVGDNVDGVRLAPQPGATIYGHLRLEAKGSLGRIDPAQMFLALRPTDGDDDELAAFGLGDGFTYLAHVNPDGSFAWKNVPPGNYYVRVSGVNSIEANWYLRTVTAGGRESGDGISVNGGSLSVEVIVNSDGGIVEGVVTNDKNEPVANAVVVAAPEARLQSRVDRFRKTVSDQRGAFTLRGISPGAYSLFAWESVEGEAYFNAEFLKSYEGQATSLHIAEGEHKELRLVVIAAGDDQP